jgi:hypothetical protein
MAARPPYTINLPEKNYLVFEDLLSYAIWWSIRDIKRRYFRSKLTFYSSIDITDI